MTLNNRCCDGRGTSVNRRRFLQTTGAIGAAGIAGCTGLMGGSQQDGVEYWTLFTGGDGDAMEGMVTEINESDDHDDLHINRQRVPHGEYYDRLYTSLTGDEYPDVAVLHADMIREYEDLVTPLTDEIGSDPYVDEVAEAVVVDGEQLAAPLDTHPSGCTITRRYSRKRDSIRRSRRATTRSSRRLQTPSPKIRTTGR
ncbi:MULTISPECIES: twin-arginine translocation signal domain-containing protein [Natrialbaceae]|uniref:twin-arginine translocation signal domain-containing protein n=1 Tax=Natrialbaceae TaxID=1644061 RepID=UPI00207CC91D|nr:twin-arginine translocation signal domain-containing protein [Natronococcus sp. CG52]